MRACLLVLSFGLIACGSEVAVDAGVARDAGADAGRGDAATVDAGVDAGADAGGDGSDAGRDAGRDAGTASDAGTDAALPQDAGPELRTGTAGCTGDGECAEGVCWDFAESDPLCGGTVCSLPCGTDTDCRTAATAAGASDPTRATCDSRNECDFVGTRLGLYFCA